MIDSGKSYIKIKNKQFLIRSISFRYENGDPTVRFTEAQLTELRKTTFAKIVCENMDVPGEMQRAAFDLPSNFL